MHPVNGTVTIVQGNRSLTVPHSAAVAGGARGTPKMGKRGGVASSSSSSSLAVASGNEDALDEENEEEEEEAQAEAEEYANMSRVEVRLWDISTH